MNFVKLSLLVFIVLSLSGCGYIYGDNGLIKSQKYDYVNAKQEKELKLPNSLVHKSNTDYAVVPKIGSKAENFVYGKELNQDAPVQLLAVIDNTRIDKNSPNPAILVVDKRDFLWSTIEGFLSAHQLATNIKDDQNYVIITQWLPVEESGVWLGIDGTDDNDLNRAKYKISLSQGQIRGEHKLSVERINSQVRNDNDEQWRSELVQWHQSADMMNLLLSYYDGAIYKKEIAQKQKIRAGFKVVLGQDKEENPSLLTIASQEMVWAKIPQVMTELGLKIIDKDLRQNSYFLEYEKKEEGFFASLFDEKQSVLPIEDGAYQVTVDQLGEQRTITIKDGQGAAIESEVLVKLFPELSRLFGDRR